MSDFEAPVTISGEFRQSLRQLVVAASQFLLKAQDLNHEQQPPYAKVFGKLILEGRASRASRPHWR
jgi:hypothetical protein